MTRQPAGWRRLGIVLVWSAAAAAVGAAAEEKATAPPVQTTEPLAQVAESPEPLVQAVEIRSDAPLTDVREFEPLVDIFPGRPLTRAAVRGTLRNLYNSGAIAETEIYTSAEASGVRVIIALWTAVRVETVELTGRLGLKESDLRAVIAQRPGEPLLEDRVLRSVYKLQDLYRENGYLEATARVRVQTDEARKRATVTFAMESGTQARIGEVRFAGDVGTVGPEKMAKVLGAKPGKKYLAATVNEDDDKLKRWLIHQGYGLAEVDPAQEDFHSESGKVDLAFPVRLGPRLEVTVRGADLDSLKKKDLLPFMGDEGYDEALVVQAIDRLRRYYQERGHFEVRIERHEERSAERLHLSLNIVPGPVFALEEVAFTGNRGVRNARLAQLMATSPRQILRPGSGRLVDEVVHEDLANIRSYYALEGYGETRVGPEAVRIEGRRIFLAIPIREGPRAELRDLALVGIQSLGDREVRKQLPLRPGGPFHPLLLREALNSLRALYGEKGFAAVQISPQIVWNAEHTQADVTLTVLEGAQTVLDQVVLRGNQHTRGDVLRRFVDLKRGEPLSTRKLLDLQRSFYRLGVFSRVDVALSPAAEDTPARDVVVRVEEGKEKRVLYGVGYDSEKGPRGLLGFSHSNLFGRLFAFQFDLRASRVDRQYRALLSQPYLGHFRIPVIYSLFRIEEKRESFDSRRRGLQIEAQRIQEGVRWGLLYTYKIVDLELDSGISPSGIAREFRNIQIASLTPSLLVDRRDDPLDPHRGWSTAAQLEYAFPFFVANERFVKLFVQGTEQVDLQRAGVLAGSLRLGGIQPLSSGPCADPTVPAGLSSCHIPISERFFAGGRTTNRAYGRDLLGLPGQSLFQGEPTGGNGLALINLDYRFPIAGPVGGIIFADSGNVWADWRSIRLRDFKTGVGVGVRYLSPIGPLRLEIGRKLKREKGEDPYVIFLSFGTPF